MRLRIVSSRAVLFIFSAAACTNVAIGQVTALHVVSQPTPADVLPGYVANDLLIDFNGQYTGSQMIVELTSGSIYQAPPPAGNTPPSSVLFPHPNFESIQWDSFLANGGLTSETTIGNFGLGGAATHLEPMGGGGPQRSPSFTNNLIDQSWNPAGGNVIEDQDGFIVARVTLSDDANGVLGYYASAAGVGQQVAMLPIRNGFVIPEPSTAVLLGIGILGLILLNCRRGWSRPFFRGDSEMRFGNVTLATALVAFSALSSPNVSSGQIKALHVVSQPTPVDVLPGYVANDILIDFSGQYGGSQMIVGLTSGEIYQAPPPAGNTPPSSVLFPHPGFESIQWDTFVANGGLTSETTIGNFGLGGAAIHVDPNFGTGTQRFPSFTNNLIDLSWNPAGAIVIRDQEAFIVARVTLSDDANGVLGYYASAGGIAGVGQPGRVAMLPIRNGFVIPEPSTILLFGIAAAAVFIAYRLQGRLARTTSATSRLRSEQPIHSWGFFHQVGARRPQNHEPHSFIARSSARPSSTVSRCDRRGRNPALGRHGNGTGPPGSHL
jgi:hypothetical protein